MAEFLDENNACGQNLLRVVSMGSSIIAEILRLKDFIPAIFRLETKADQQKYADIILDFSYLKIAEAQDRKIEENAELQELDDEVRDNYLELLTRFYLLFESTHQYGIDLQQYIEELNRGYYIQHNLESVMQDLEGKQLMCEALYLFGLILLNIDFYIPGIIRERMIISYYRYSSAKSHGDSRIDEVCMLLRSTGFQAISSSSVTTINNMKNVNVSHYPEAYFGRFSFDEYFLDMVIGRLRCDDVYNQLSIYPHPDHRSTALSTQAAMLFICLYFSPKVLHNHVAQMREIVDKFFSDNWIISIYMGITVNLIDAWDQFKAAKTAITSVVETTTIRGNCLLRREKMAIVFKQTKEMLRDGVLSDDFVLQNITKIVLLIRECNVLLRWYLLHTSSAVLEFSNSIQKIIQNIKQNVCKELQYDCNDLFELLINCSKLELNVKETLRQLMQEKKERWETFRREALDRMNELSATFSGSRPLAKIESNMQLKLWFDELSKEIKELNLNSPNSTGRMLIQLIQALEEVQEYHNLQTNMHIKQYLKETLEFLKKMIQIINIREDILVDIQLISDLSYAWHILNRDFTNNMQDSIKKNPQSVINLRAMFLKLASILEIPLLRINQAKSEDLISVSKYYSTELANYMRKVLQIIPETMFASLARIIQLQTDVLKEIPMRLEKEKVKEYAQFEDRFKVAKLTHSIAVFTEGILMMKKTLVGVIELDPKQLLEDGIRKELVRHLSNALNVGLIFTPNKTKNPTAELESKLASLANIIDGYRRSFEYVQDYLNIHGLKILQEEFTRIVHYNVERECNAFLRNKIQDWQSQYQSETIPLPTFPPVQGDVSKSNNFIGRLAYEILQCTDPKQTIFLELKGTWYDRRAPHKEIFELKFFGKIREAIGTAGLVGLDNLYAYMLAADLKCNLDKIHKNTSNDKMWIEALTTLSNELEVKQEIENPVKYYGSYHSRWLKVWPTLLDWIVELGHKQIIRQQLSFELSRSSKCNSKNLHSALETFNRALLNELEHCDPNSKFAQNSQDIFIELDDYLLFNGAFEPLEQVFVKTKNLQQISVFLFLFTISQIPHLQFCEKTNTLKARTGKDLHDGIPLVVGLLTILQQFNNDFKLLYITYLCQYVTTLIETNLSTKQEISPESITTLHFLEIFIRIGKMPRTILSSRIPEIILTQYLFLASNNKS